MEVQYLTIAEVATALRVSPVTVWRWCQRGVLPAVRLGRTWRIPREALEARLEAQWRTEPLPVESRETGL